MTRLVHADVCSRVWAATLTHLRRNLAVGYKIPTASLGFWYVLYQGRLQFVIYELCTRDKPRMTASCHLRCDGAYIQFRKTQAAFLKICKG